MIASSQSSGVIEVVFGIIGMMVMLSPFWIPIICGVIGSIGEKRHYESIHARERASAHVPVMPTSVSDDS